MSADSFTVALPDGARFSARGDENLLAAAQRAHWLVRYGCRNGNCLACSARLCTGSVQQRDETITASDVASQEILLCLCQARSDLTIELPGNPQHGSSAQARRSFARLERSEHDADTDVLHFLLPAGRRPPLYPGQYALIETPAGSVRAEIDTHASQDRLLVLRMAAGSLFTAGAHHHLRYPLGYGYAKTTATSVLILTGSAESKAATLLRQAFPDAVTQAGEAFDQLVGQRFSIVLACARSDGEAQRWYDALLQAQVEFVEFRSDDHIRHRWRVMRQDDHGTCVVMATGLSEAAASAQAQIFERRGHKQLYWAEPVLG